jgi:hypothetical protein
MVNELVKYLLRQKTRTGEMFKLLDGRFINRNNYDKKLLTLRKLQAELGFPTMPDIHIGIEVREADGTISYNSYQQGHSWTRNGWNWFVQVLTDAAGNVAGSSNLNGNWTEGNLTWRAFNSHNISGSTTNISTIRSTTQSEGHGFLGGLGSQTPGIVIGSSAEPFSAEDYCMFSGIGSGTSANQMIHGLMARPQVVYNLGTKTYSVTWSRVFNNNSPGVITVNEAGLMFSSVGLVSRDVLAAPVTVSVGAQLTINIVLTSQSFAALESAAIVPPPIGSAIGGGTALGNFLDWTGSTTLGSVGGHAKYLLVLSPKTGGDIAPLAMRTTNTGFPFVTDGVHGLNCTQAMIALGSESPMGQAIAAQRAANLGGFNDWILPSPTEFTALYQVGRIGAIPSGELNTSAFYMTSATNNAISYATYNGATGSFANHFNLTSASRARLIRRHKFA